MEPIQEYTLFNNTLKPIQGSFLTINDELVFEGLPDKWRVSGLQINPKKVITLSAFTHIRLKLKVFCSDNNFDPTFYLRYYPSISSKKLKLSSYGNIQEFHSDFKEILIPLEDFIEGSFDIDMTEDLVLDKSPIVYSFYISNISLYNANYVEVFEGPKFKVNVTDLNFGTLPDNVSMTMRLLVSNEGDQILENIELQLPDHITTDINNFNLEPSETKEINITYTDITEIIIPDPSHDIDSIFNQLFDIYEQCKVDMNMKASLKEHLKLFIEKI